MRSFSSDVWTGNNRIIIAIDLGSTYSGVSYAYLAPKAPRCVARVSDWPGQGNEVMSSKIPTIIYYDKNNEPAACGAEALGPAAEESAEEHQWTLVKEFKLHVHPPHMKEKLSLPLDELPPGLSLEQVYRHFFQYLLKYTRKSFLNRVLDGHYVWQRYFPRADIVIAHPNGWTIKEQHFLRKAAVDSGFVDPLDKMIRVSFVTEGEASLHYCMFHADLAPRLSVGTQFIVCDAGGSTVDMTTYEVAGTRPAFQVREIKPSECIQAGGIFVDMLAENHIRLVLAQLSAQVSLEEEVVDDIVKQGRFDFENGLKRTFKGPTQDGFIRTSSHLFLLPDLKRGRLRVHGAKVESFFTPFVDQILDGLRRQMDRATVKYILLVGGFGESEYLREKVREAFPLNRHEIVIVNDATSKAVSDGAVIWRATTAVIARACRFTFGHPDFILFDPTNEEHRKRGSITLPDGSIRVKGAFDPLAIRGSQFKPDEVVKRRFCAACRVPRDLIGLHSALYCYTPTRANDLPRWYLDEHGETLPGFHFLCKITSDLSPLASALRLHEHKGQKHYTLEYSMCLRFGGTELVAYIEWAAEGEMKRSDAQIILNALE